MRNRIPQLNGTQATHAVRVGEIRPVFCDLLIKFLYLRVDRENFLRIKYIKIVLYHFFISNKPLCHEKKINAHPISSGIRIFFLIISIT